MNRRGLILLSCASLQALGWSATAAAQTEPAADDRALDEIIVTAQKRAENLQDVPIAVTAINGGTLDAAGIENTQDLVTVVPGLTVRKTNNAFQPFIRGIGTTAGFVENPVALYVDGVYIADQRAAQVQFNDVEQVAVLKGPQGTLFGRNSTAGVIQITTRDPGEDLQLFGSAGIDNYLTLRTDGYVSGGLADNITASVSGSYTKQFDGYGRNRTTGREVVKTDHDLSVRGKLVFTPGEDTKLVLIGEHIHQRFFGANQRPYPGTVSPYPGFPANLRRYDSVANLDRVLADWADSASLRVEQGIGGARLTSITAYRRTDALALVDADGAPLTYAHIAILNAPNRMFTQELQLASDDTGAFKWQVGAFYFWNKYGVNPSITTLNRPAVPFPLGATLTRVSSQTAESFAGFAQASWEFVPDTTLTGGIRYTHEKREFTGVQTTTPGGGVPPPIIGRQTSSQKINRPTYRISLDHKFGEGTLAYASFNTGFKSGGYNLLAPTSPPFLPEKLSAYEAGVKSELFDRTVRFNAAAFYYDYTNIQVFQVINAVSTVSNAARARVYGMDADLEAQLSRQLKLSGGIALLSAKYRNFQNAQFANVSATGVVTLRNCVTDPRGCDASGNRLPQSQKFAGNLALDYDTPLGGGDVHFNITASYQGNYYLEPDNFMKQGDYVLLNSSLRVELPGGHASVTLWGRNLLNEYVQTFGSVSPLQGAAANYDAPPLTVGMTFGFKL